MPRKMPAVKSNKFNKNIAALEEHSQQQQKDYRQKQQQLSDASRSERAKREDAGNSGESSRKANVALLQPIQIISSDDDATTDAAHSSFSDGHGFAGFASPSSNLANVTPVTSCRSLRQRHAAVIKENSSGCLAIPKRSSLGSRKSAECISPPEYEKLLPAKRRKDQCQMGAENAEGLHLPPNMQTPPPDQVVEVSSNSSTHSQQQQQRVLRRSTLQQQTNIPQKLITKASTETSSEFPVSSPSNPQPGGSKFPQRPPLLKNTLPADSFERQLALVAARNPQMTLADKMQAWQCETELSDVEDVNEFDARFQTAEEKKRKTSKCQKSPESLEDDYDFQHFRYVVLNNLRSQMNLAQQKEDEWDKPSTSAAAAAHARRQEVKKSRPLKESTQQKKKTQSSTTPAPASSSASISASSHGSSEYLAAVGNTSPGRKKNPTNTNLAPKLQIHEVLCPSSSTDASMHVACVSHKPSATTTVPTSTVTTSTAKNKEAGTGQLAPNKFNSKELIADAAKNVAPLSPKPINIQCSSTEEDSVFRLNRLNREIDKTKLELPLSNRAEPKRLIQMHLDFLAEKEKLNLREKKFELFKTPVVPARYSPTSQNCCQQQQTSSDNQVNNNNNNNNCNSKSNSIINRNCKTTSKNIKININKCSNATHSSASKNNKEIDIHDSNYPSFMSPCDSCDSYDFTRSAKDMVKLAMHATAKAKQHDRMRQQHEDVMQQQQGGMQQQQNVLQQHCLQQQPEGMHQQHEFCNYLGLTGMSTANAVANAVAELAKSNIARRSLRVRRQQHTQDKQEKNNREQKILEALKIKQLREIKRRDKPMKSSLDELNEQIAKVEPGESLIDTKSDEQDIANKNQLLNNIQTLAQAMPLPAVNNVKDTVKKEPEIKIICHIAADADDHEEVEKVSKKYVKKLTDPIRNTLIREINEGNAVIGVDASLQSPTEEAARCELGKLQLESLNEMIKKEVAENETLPPTNDEDSSDSLPSDKKSVIEIGAQEHKQQFCQHQQLDQQQSERSSNKVVAEAKIEDLLMANTQEKLHMKFQEYLEASRRAKPSIYIVQSIDNDRDIKKKYVLTEVVKAGDAGAASAGTGGTNSVEAAKATPAKGKEFCSLQNVPIDSRLSAGAIDIKRKNRKHLSKLLTRSVLNMTQQRQLRNRKIVILKTIKRKSLKTRSKEKKLKKSKQSLQNKESMGNCIKVALEETQKKSSVTARRRHTAVITKYSNGNIESNYDAEAGHVTILYEQNTQMKDSAMDMKPVENDLVVVSSTTNCYDEQGTKERGRKTPESVASRRTFVLDDNIIYTKESGMQCSPTPITGLSQLTPPSSPMRNPLKAAQGKVLYIYYELDVLIVVQETLISFWKYSKLLLVLNMLANKTSAAAPQQQAKHSNNQLRQQEQREVETSSSLPTSSPPLDADAGGGAESGFEWLHLGECKRLQYDYEISTPYANRICIHNSMPIYIEMRCKELQKERRDCNLCSLYINIYFYNDEEMLAKMHSIQLDAVQSVPQNVIYTTITDSRYFVMSWPQENIMGKVRSGLCKYSLTPHLDTLASIREFKSMRNEIRYLECSDDDKLLGFGATQLTIWDHRSGDVLMNYDLGLSLGRNLGSIYYPSLEIGQNSMILLFQLLPYMKESEESEESEESKEQTDATAKSIEEQHAEVHVMVCNISHLAPSHRVLYRHVLPSPAFTKLFSAINTGDHLLLTAPNDEEIWISCNDPKMMTLLPAQNSQRFYTRGRSQLIELTEHSLSVDCIANHVLKISTATI